MSISSTETVWGALHRHEQQIAELKKLLEVANFKINELQERINNAQRALNKG